MTLDMLRCNGFRWNGVATLLLGLALLVTPGVAGAITLLPGDALEVDFSVSSAPSTAAGAVDVVVFRFGPGATSSGLTSLAVELWDGASHVSTGNLVPTGAAGFAESASAWTLNKIVSDLSTLRAGTVAGVVRVVPTFDGSTGARLDVDFFPATGLSAGHATGPSSLVPSVPALTVGSARVVPEPGLAWLGLAGAAALAARRPRGSASSSSSH